MTTSIMLVRPKQRPFMGVNPWEGACQTQWLSWQVTSLRRGRPSLLLVGPRPLAATRYHRHAYQAPAEPNPLAGSISLPRSFPFYNLARETTPFCFHHEPCCRQCTSCTCPCKCTCVSTRMCIHETPKYKINYAYQLKHAHAHANAYSHAQSCAYTKY